MTDKQIIIDGVDVSGCEYCGYDNVCKLKSASNYIVDCKENPSCYYKQLKRKEQECEKLKESIEENSYRYAELDADYDQLKVKCKSLEDISGRLQKQNHELTLENEKLEQYKASKQVSYEQLQKSCNELELGIRKLQKQFGIEILYCKATGESTFRSTEILKLKQTLTEIKEIAYELTNEEYTDFIEEKQKQILNKISEVIENE